MYKVTVTSKGQITLPAEARKRLQINEGDILTVKIENGNRLVFTTNRRKMKSDQGVIERTAGIWYDMKESGAEYTEKLRRSSSRLDRLYEGSN